METAELLQQVRRGESQLKKELREIDIQCGENIIEVKKNVRQKAKESLKAKESPEQQMVRQHIEHLQLRLELLRNIRLNWKNFEKHANERNIELRINQFTALQHLINFLETGHGEEPSEEEIELSRALMAYEVQPTGAGKTGAFAIETALLDVPTLILVPFDNLVEQTKEDLIKIGGIDESNIGLVYGDVKEFGCKVTVATYAGHAAQMRKRNGEYAKFVRDNVKYCICDEVHTSLGDRTQESLEAIDGLGDGKLSAEEKAALDAEQEVLQHLEKQLSVKALKIGYTATPKLAQKHVEEYFPHFLGRVFHKDMVDAGILVPYRIVQCDGSVSEGEVGDYISKQLEIEILNREDIYKKLLGEYAFALQSYGNMKKKNQYPLRGMAFCTNHAECEKFAKEAELLGLRCRIVTGKEAKGKSGREVIKNAKAELCSGEIDLIVTVEKLCAGFNFPEVNAIIWGRVTSMAKTIQGIGRGGRSHKEGKLRKECCWVFETNWTLKGNAKRGKKPLRIADALVENGEDPEAICTMADGSKLQYQEKIYESDSDGIVYLDDKSVGVIIATYASSIGIAVKTLEEKIIAAQLLPIAKGKYRSGPKDVYSKDEIDNLEYVKLHFESIENVVDDNGLVTIGDEICVAATAYAFANEMNHKEVKLAIEESGIEPIGKARSWNMIVPVFKKDDLDNLPYVKKRLGLKGKIINEDGTILMGDILAIGDWAYAETLEISGKTLRAAIIDAKLECLGSAKTKRGGRALNIYRKNEVDQLPLVLKLNEANKIIIDDTGIVELPDKRIGVAITAYAFANSLTVHHVNNAVKAAELKSISTGRRGSGVVNIYLKSEVDALQYVKDRI